MPISGEPSDEPLSWSMPTVFSLSHLSIYLFPVFAYPRFPTNPSDKALPEHVLDIFDATHTHTHTPFHTPYLHAYIFQYLTPDLTSESVLAYAFYYATSAEFRQWISAEFAGDRNVSRRTSALAISFF